MKSLAAACLLAASAAHAQFKCVTADGATAFQDAPCPRGAASQPLALPAPAAPPSEREQRIAYAISLGRVAVGMTRAEFDRASRYRKPDADNTSFSAGAETQQLVYRTNCGLHDDRSTCRTLYVYLRNGVVTSFSDSR